MPRGLAPALSSPSGSRATAVTRPADQAGSIVQRQHSRPGVRCEPDEEPVGKRLDFLLQEIHRETNTINSKSQDLEISRQALALKSEAEKIREQIQNLE